MSRRTASIAAGFALAAFFGGPVSSASAECYTLVECTVEYAQGLPEQKLRETQEYLDQTREDAERAAEPVVREVDRNVQGLRNFVESRVNELRDDAVRRITTRSLVCVIEGRWVQKDDYYYDNKGDATARAQCSVHDPAAPSEQVAVRNGTLAAPDTFVHEFRAGAPLFDPAVSGYLSTTSGPNEPLLTLGSKAYEIASLWGAGETSLQIGYWHFAEADTYTRPVEGATILVPAQTVDPTAGSDDQFIEAVWVFHSFTDTPVLRALD